MNYLSTLMNHVFAEISSDVTIGAIVVISIISLTAIVGFIIIGNKRK